MTKTAIVNEYNELKNTGKLEARFSFLHMRRDQLVNAIMNSDRESDQDEMRESLYHLDMHIEALRSCVTF